jgi:hypothetical protein
MKRLLIAILAAAAVGGSPVGAQEVSRRNQDMDARPNLQSEQTVGGHTPAPGVKVQPAQPAPQSRRRRPDRASKTPPHLPGAAPTTPN